MLIVSLYS